MSFHLRSSDRRRIHVSTPKRRPRPPEGVNAGRSCSAFFFWRWRQIYARNTLFRNGGCPFPDVFCGGWLPFWVAACGVSMTRDVQRLPPLPPPSVPPSLLPSPSRPVLPPAPPLRPRAPAARRRGAPPPAAFCPLGCGAWPVSSRRVSAGGAGAGGRRSRGMSFAGWLPCLVAACGVSMTQAQDVKR